MSYIALLLIAVLIAIEYVKRIEFFTFESAEKEGPGWRMVVIVHQKKWFGLSHDKTPVPLITRNGILWHFESGQSVKFDWNTPLENLFRNYKIARDFCK